MPKQSTLLLDLGHSLKRQKGAPLYEQLADLLREGIATGELQPGESLIPQRQLSVLWNVSEVTVRRAMQALAAEGLLEARAGSGTMVAAAKEVSASPYELPTTGRRIRLGIVSAQLTDGYPFLSRMMERVQGDADGPIFQFFSVPVDEADAQSLHRMLPLRELDGVLLMSPVNLGLVALCQQLKVPYVLLYNHLADGRSRCIVVDYTPGILAAVGHLVATGKRKIALVTATESRFSTGLMTDAYHAAIGLHRLSANPAWLIAAGYEESQGYEATKKLLACEDRPDAILFASDYQARGGLIALQEAGLAVPREIAVIGAGQLLRDKEWPVPLTTIDLHFEQVGLMAVATMQRLIAKQTDVPFRQVATSNLILGETA